MFPENVLLRILKALGPADLCRTTLVSWRFHYLSDDDALWKPLYFSTWRPHSRQNVTPGVWKELFALQARRQRLLARVDRVSLLEERVDRLRRDFEQLEAKHRVHQQKLYTTLDTIGKEIHLTRALLLQRKHEALRQFERSVCSVAEMRWLKWTREVMHTVDRACADWTSAIQSQPIPDCANLAHSQENCGLTLMTVMNEGRQKYTRVMSGEFNPSSEPVSLTAWVKESPPDVNDKSAASHRPQKRPTIFHFLRLSMLTIDYVEKSNVDEAKRQIHHREDAVHDMREELLVQEQAVRESIHRVKALSLESGERDIVQQRQILVALKKEFDNARAGDRERHRQDKSREDEVLRSWDVLIKNTEDLAQRLEYASSCHNVALNSLETGLDSGSRRTRLLQWKSIRLRAAYVEARERCFCCLRMLKARAHTHVQLLGGLIQ